MITFDETTRDVLLLLVGAALFEAGRELRESTPEYHELRNADSDDHHIKQYLIDGQAHTGIIVGGAALIAAWACKSLYPALVLIAVYGGLVWYQHSVYRSPAPAAA
jgi:hypothetical protein